MKTTLQLTGKHALVAAGDDVVANSTVLSSVVERRADLAQASGGTWDPIGLLSAPLEVDRYAAAKALPYRPDLVGAKAALTARLAIENDARVKLEIASSLAKLGEKAGLDAVAAVAADPERGDLRMEAVLILGEIATADAITILDGLAGDESLAGSELRQAAVWELGVAGAKGYSSLAKYVGDAEDDVALHAICGFGADVPEEVVASLIASLRAGEARVRAGASASLRQIGSDVAIRKLVDAARADSPEPWVLATLGQMPPARVAAILAGDPLLERLQPLLILAPETNWLGHDTVTLAYDFLSKQRPPST